MRTHRQDRPGTSSHRITNLLRVFRRVSSFLNPVMYPKHPRAHSHRAQVRQRLEELYREENVPASREEYQAKVQKALQVRDLLMQNTEEMDSLVKALNGGSEAVSCWIEQASHLTVRKICNMYFCERKDLQNWD
jgi:hypothetical protein